MQMTQKQSNFDSRELRSALGSFVTGVTIITTVDRQGTPYGLTANSFSSVSLEPPLVLWSQSLGSPSYPVFQEADRFSISILSEHQKDLSSKFAKSGADKFEGVETIKGIGGIPLIKGASAYLECRKVTSYPGGDHAVFIGEVERIERSNRNPLVFGGGKYLVAYPQDLGGFSPDLGIANRSQLYGVRIGTSAIAELASRLGTTTCLGVWGNKGPTIVRWEESARPVSASLRTGVVLPVLRSAAGQIFGAYLPRALTQPFIDEELRLAARVSTPEFYASGAQVDAARDFGDILSPETAETLVRVDLKRAAAENQSAIRMTPAQADQLLAGVRERGLSRNVDLEPESVEEEKVVAMSAPVFDEEGVVLLALTVLGYRSEFDDGWESPIARALSETAAEISRKLGFTGG